MMVVATGEGVERSGRAMWLGGGSVKADEGAECAVGLAEVAIRIGVHCAIVGTGVGTVVCSIIIAIVGQGGLACLLNLLEGLAVGGSVCGGLVRPAVESARLV